jgi:hypothetical protein
MCVMFRFQSRRHLSELMGDFLRRFPINFKFRVFNY